MRLRQIATALSLCSSLALGFRDTSPFFLFSNSDLFESEDPFPTIPFAKSSQVTQALVDTFASCPVDAYILVSQPGALVSDYENSQAVAYLERKMTRRDGYIEATQALTHVVGKLDIDAMQKYLAEKCGATLAGDHRSDGFAESSAPFPWVYRVDFDALPEQQSARYEMLAKHDSYLHALLSSFSQKKYVVVYSTTPPSTLPLSDQTNQQEQQHPMHFFDFDAEDARYGTLHTNMKRGEAVIEARQSNASNSTNNAPLFEKYNFFTPAIFVAILITVILLSILYVGISAIASLEVSYAAFNKENGPQAQAQRSTT